MYDTKGVPQKVLKGQDKRYLKVFNLYRARMAQEVMRRLNHSFWNRARGNTDDVAGKWKELKPSTIRYKRSTKALHEHGIIRDWYDNVEGFESGANQSFKRTYSPGQLSPEDQTKFNALVKSILEKDTKGGARLARAKKEAWKEFNDERDIANLINIRTGRLVAATAPGVVANNRYYAPTDQSVRITFRATRISLNAVPYARAVDNERPIIPSNIEVWKREAHQVVIDEVAALYKEIKSMYDSLPKRKRKKKKKSPTIDNYIDDVPF